MSDPSAPAPAFGEIPPPPRLLARWSHRRLAGRLAVAAVAGIIMGIAISNQTAAHRREAALLTKEQYIAEFDSHKRKLEGAGSSAPALIFVSVVMVLVAAGLYEWGGRLVAPAVGWVDDKFARRDAERRSHVRDDTDV